MKIFAEHIVVEFYVSDIHDNEEVGAFRKVYETTDDRFFIEKPKGYFMLQEISEENFNKMQKNYEVYISHMNQYEYEDVLPKTLKKF